MESKSALEFIGRKIGWMDDGRFTESINKTYLLCFCFYFLGFFNHRKWKSEKYI